MEIQYRIYSGHNTTNTVCRTQDMQWWAQRVGACKCFKLHPHAGASLQWRLPYARKKARDRTIQIQILLEHKYTTWNSMLWRPVVADFNLGLNSQLNKTLNLKSFYWHLATIKRIRSPKQQNKVQISKYHATEATSHAFFEEKIDTSSTSIVKKPSPLHHHRGIAITIIFDLKC